MEKLGNTDIDVSAICLGTMTWGQQNTQKEGFEQMDYAIDMGVNFFDTAEMYSVPPKKEHKDRQKRLLEIGLMKENRDSIILATKVCGRAPFTWLRDDKSPTEHSKNKS